MKRLSTSDRFDILGCKISAANIQSAVEAIDNRIKSAEGGYVCFSNVHTVVTSKENILLKDSINHSFLSLPDGKPLSVYAKFKGYSDVEQVAGPDFMPLCINEFPDAKHYFYGSTELTLDKLKENLLTNHQGISIVGMYSPPFRELTDSEIEKIQKDITATKPDFIWVGLGAPKQEIWMMKNYTSLEPAILFGVGAAFDFHAGLLDRCPKWVQNAGLEWFYRLMCEPGRLWKRYLVTNTSFIYYLVLEVLTGTSRD